MQNSINICGLSDSIAYCEAKGLANCFSAYAEHCSGDYISSIWFNENSGSIYLNLEDGITISCCMGQDVEYIVTNFETGEKHYFDTYKEAESFDYDELKDFKTFNEAPYGND